MKTLLAVFVMGMPSHLLAHAESGKDQTEQHRIIIKADIAKLPKKLTVAQLFKIWYPVHLPDPPLFIYPTEADEHLYFVVAHPDDSDNLAIPRGQSLKLEKARA